MANSIFLALPENYRTTILHKARSGSSRGKRVSRFDPSRSLVGTSRILYVHLPLSPAACTPVVGPVVAEDKGFSWFDPSLNKLEWQTQFSQHHLKTIQLQFCIKLKSGSSRGKRVSRFDPSRSLVGTSRILYVHLPLSPAACTPVHRAAAATVPPYVCLPNRYIAAKVPCTSTPVPAHSSVRSVTLLIDLNDVLLSIKCGSIFHNYQVVSYWFDLLFLVPYSYFETMLVVGCPIPYNIPDDHKVRKSSPFVKSTFKDNGYLSADSSQQNLLCRFLSPDLSL